MQKLGMLARQEVALKSPSEITGAPRHLDKQEDEREQQQQMKRAESRESTRAEYLEACVTHPAHAAKMARLFPHLLFDLIQESGRVA